MPAPLAILLAAHHVVMRQSRGNWLIGAPPSQLSRLVCPQGLRSTPETLIKRNLVALGPTAPFLVASVANMGFVQTIARKSQLHMVAALGLPDQFKLVTRDLPRFP